MMWTVRCQEGGGDPRRGSSPRASCSGVLRAVALLVLVSGAATELQGAVAAGGRGVPAPADAAPLRCPPATSCQYDGSVADEHFYTVNDAPFVVVLTDAYLSLRCGAAHALDDAALPRAPRPRAVPRAHLDACAPPPRGYRAALAALNLTVLDALRLRRLPAAPRAAQLAGLAVRELELAGASPPAARVPLPADALAALPALRALALERLALPAAALERLPPTLETLTLRDTEPPAPSAAALARLPALRRLALQSRELVSLPALAAPALRALAVVAPLATLPDLRYLENATFVGVQNVSSLGPCAALRRLALEGAPRAALPAGWLACSGLRELRVRRCGLRAIPLDLFATARELRTVDLSHNAIDHLPEGIFAPLTQLEELELSHNALAGGAALRALAAAPRLQRLALAHNPLGDLCAPSATSYAAAELSPLYALRALRALSLAHTRAARLCADWRRDLRALRALDLAHNDVTELQLEDLQWSSEMRSVQLSGNPLAAVRVTRAQYERLAAAPPPSRAAGGLVEIKVDSVVECDCLVYWFARAQRERVLPARVEGLRCAGPPPRPLRDVPPDDMVCVEEAACPANCSCSWHARDDRAAVRCAAAGRRRLPALAALPGRRVRLDVSGNRVAAAGLRAAELPARLEELDLSDNLLEELDSETAAALFAHARRVWLARNPLRCACGAGGGGPPALLLAVRAHAPQVVDYDWVTCADGARARDAALQCGAATWRAALAAAAALAGSAALLALAARALRRDARLRLKAYLLLRRLCPAWLADDDDDEYEYDAFLSFSHKDVAVAEALAAVLEAGPRPLRLCLHHRDWRAGDWIPAQIARSVRVSRRTVVLVSAHFAASRWARAELREARARQQSAAGAAPRLLAVLLQRRLPPLDAELRRCVREHVCCRLGEPAFWDKLRRALPPGRPPPPATPATPATPANPANPAGTID